MTFSCQGLYACISHSCVWARIGPTQATNKVTSYFTSHFSRLTNVQQGGVFIHTLTHVHQHMYNMHAYNDIKTKLHNTLTHNGEYTTTYFSPLKHKQVGNLEFLYIPITLFLYSLPIQFSIMPDQSGHPKWRYHNLPTPTNDVKLLLCFVKLHVWHCRQFPVRRNIHWSDSPEAY